MEPHRRETADRGPSEIRVDLPLCLRAPQQREGPLADPTHGKCTGVLHSARELRQGSGSGKEETHPAGSRQGRLAHGEEGSGGPRRDTPGVPTLPLPGAPTLREAVAPFQRGGSEPLLRGDRRVGGGARSALRGPERQARAHPIVHPLPLVAASGMTNKAIQTDLVSAFQLVSFSRAQVLADMLRRRRSRRRRRARTSYGFLSDDLLHGDLAVFEGRGVAGIYDAGSAQAVLSVLAFPGTFPDGLDEAPDNGVVSFARFDLRRYDGGHAGHVGVDTDGIAGAVVPHLHLRSTVGAVQGDAKVIARLTVGGPAGLQVQRGPTGEADEGCRQVL